MKWEWGKETTYIGHLPIPNVTLCINARKRMEIKQITPSNLQKHDKYGQRATHGTSQ